MCNGTSTNGTGKSLSRRLDLPCKTCCEIPLPVEHFDYVTYHADQTVLLRGISQIDTKEGWMRYLLQAKAKWQANDGKLSYDFTDRLFKTAHSPQVAKIIEQSPEFKEYDKEFVSPCNNCGNHLDMKIKMKSPTRMTNFNTYIRKKPANVVNWKLARKQKKLN